MFVLIKNKIAIEVYMKLCMKGKFVHIKNMSKEHLCRVSVSDFWDVFFWPEKFTGLSRNGPMNTK